MSLFMKDPKKTAMLILDSALKKKAQTSDGAYKDHSLSNADEAEKIFRAITSQSKESLVSSLRGLIKSVMNEETDESPAVEKAEMESGDCD